MNIDINNLTKHVVGTKDFIKVNPDLCNNCGLCFKICVASLWGKKDGKVAIADDYKSRCLECGSCGEVCVPGAIQFSYPEGGKGVIYEHG